MRKAVNGSVCCNSWIIAFTLICIGTVHAVGSIPYPYGQGSQDSDIEESEDPEIMYTILTKLGQSILRANELEKIENKKRGLDLGLNRSYSGSQQAKHMMGIAAASGGPGRRRRSQDTYRSKLSYQ